MRALADKLNACFSLRTMVVIVGLLLILLPASSRHAEWLDYLLFDLGVNLHNAPQPTLGISLVELPPEELHHLTRDPGLADRTLNLLKRVSASNKVAVGVILPEPLAALPPTLEALLWDGEGPAPFLADEAGQVLREYLETNRSLQAYNDHPKVLLSTASSRASTVIEQPSAASDYALWLLPSLRPKLQTAIAPNDARARSLALLVGSDAQVQAGFLAELYGRFVDAPELVWHQYMTLQVGSSHYPLSPDGSFIPYPHPPLNSARSLDEALAERLGNNLILLGAADSSALYSAANALRSLDAHTYYRTPYWFAGGEVLLFLLVTLYLTMLLPRLSHTAGILASSLLLLILVVSQVGSQITQWLWLPTGMVMHFLVLGHLLIVLWKRQKDRVLRLQAMAHGARYQLGLQLFRDGRSDDALLAVRECFTSEAVLALMYDIAAQQERKRLYSEAIKTYMAIVKRQPKFRDAAQKVEKLMAFSSGGAASLGADSEIAKTLIISESSISKPVLGRYEVERELGRGAMGIVYLGRDPKISRLVAIKTLSYGQLDPRDLEEFKQRFFREAEAAGRLSHPNIVTIYDVGEEHDLAFIAMDYVKGKALSAYASKANLLPVDEVLRLIAEVADALEYAHSKQVIHRDIKPANIMYEPESGRIKVTDFGVARIVDSAKTSTGDILGSPLYMAPEQLKGGKVRRETDVYSLGVTLFQLLSGKLPFEGENLANLTYNIIHNRTPNIRELRPELPTGITRIVNRALHKEPDKRYPRAAGLADALRRLLADI